MLFTCCSSDSEMKAETASAQDMGKTLVVYYSYTGDSRNIVNALTAQTEADVLEIQPAEKGLKYEADNYAIGTQLLNAIKANPNSAGSYPAIDPVAISDLSAYQNIIIVTPLWWSQMAAIMQTYLFNHGAQMAGKHVGLIVSSHSSGISGVVTDARRLVPDAIWTGDALWINNSNRSQTASLLTDWLAAQNFQTNQTTEAMKMNIIIGGVTKTVTLVDNAATQELVTRLRQSPVTLSLDTNGSFEIWGPLGFSLPTSNQQLTAQPGDVILYSGSNICLFCGSNSWNYTRLGHIDGLSEAELRTFLHIGESDISVTLSLAAQSADLSEQVAGTYTGTLSFRIDNDGITDDDTRAEGKTISITRTGEGEVQAVVDAVASYHHTYKFTLPQQTFTNIRVTKQGDGFSLQGEGFNGTLSADGTLSFTTSFDFIGCEANHTFIGRNTATGIAEVRSTHARPKGRYSLSGASLSGRPERGIYIENGKKIIVKMP